MFWLFCFSRSISFTLTHWTFRWARLLIVWLYWPVIWHDGIANLVQVSYHKNFIYDNQFKIIWFKQIIIRHASHDWSPPNSQSDTTSIDLLFKIGSRLMKYVNAIHKSPLYLSKLKTSSVSRADWRTKSLEPIISLKLLNRTLCSRSFDFYYFWSNFHVKCM